MRAKFERQLCGLGCANEALAVKFDSPDEMAVKFERKSLNLSPCQDAARWLIKSQIKIAFKRSGMLQVGAGSIYTPARRSDFVRPRNKNRRGK